MIQTAKSKIVPSSTKSLFNYNFDLKIQKYKI